jgi:hypothetical protein
MGFAEVVSGNRNLPSLLPTALGEDAPGLMMAASNVEADSNARA